ALPKLAANRLERRGSDVALAGGPPRVVEPIRAERLPADVSEERGVRDGSDSPAGRFVVFGAGVGEIAGITADLVAHRVFDQAARAVLQAARRRRRKADKIADLIGRHFRTELTREPRDLRRH